MSSQIFGGMEGQPNSSRVDSLQIKIIESYSKINSVSELLKRFEGKPVFIDLWATWCLPCFAEFDFSKPLHEFLVTNDIEMIYISFDNDEQDSLWRIKIQENKLSGYHIRANKSLKDSITTLIWGGIDVVNIPHYLLFNQYKVLVNKSASPPSAKIKLYQEIETDLKH